MSDTLIEQSKMVSIGEACEWASNFLNKKVTNSNISYLIQYGKINKHKEDEEIKVNLNELKQYYSSYNGKREIEWKNKLGDDLNWALSFDNYKEKDTTKHVHRLHPYKGKFIPQLVEYFLDDHIDDFKTQQFFKKNDVVLDPFMGSGTTLVQANELGIHSIGIDISSFNCLISSIKLENYNFEQLVPTLRNIDKNLDNFENDQNFVKFDTELSDEIFEFNTEYFPSPAYKRNVYTNKIDENTYSEEKEKEFLKIFNDLNQKYSIKLDSGKSGNFLDVWYTPNARREIDFVMNQIKKIKEKNIKKILAVILSRAIRSCRATTHSDLATLKKPQLSAYYCYKHKKICKPLYSIKKMFKRYAYDTINRLKEFEAIKTNSMYCAIPGDSRTVDIDKILKYNNSKLYQLIISKGIDGIFTSPPYVGQIDYHEQHAYAYDLLGYKRNDELEIGPLFKGRGIEARKSYVNGISDVLLNCKKYLRPNANIFLVANDRFNLYPEIANRSGYKIVNQFKRPVLNRTERDQSPYSEIIFHFI